MAGKFKSFCAPHAAVLSGIVVGPVRPLGPKPAAKPGPPPPPKPEPVEPRCQVPGCNHKIRTGRPVCGTCRLDELPPDVQAAYKAEQAARPHKKPGRPPKAA